MAIISGGMSAVESASERSREGSRQQLAMAAQAAHLLGLDVRSIHILTLFDKLESKKDAGWAGSIVK